MKKTPQSNPCQELGKHLLIASHQHTGNWPRLIPVDGPRPPAGKLSYPRMSPHPPGVTANKSLPADQQLSAFHTAALRVTGSPG